MDKVYKTMGSKGNEPRQSEDFYETPEIAVRKLLHVESFCDNILEPACGKGAISKILAENHKVHSYDLMDRGYGQQKDFFEIDSFSGDIITNPPYNKDILLKFVEHAMELLEPNRKCAMLLKIQFLESKSRRVFFEKYPPKNVYVFSERISCLKEGVPAPSAMCYCWYVWQKGFNGKPTLDWI